MTLEEYWTKRKSKQYEEASEIVRQYRKAFGKDPLKKDLPAYFFLFENGLDNLDEVYQSKLKLCGNYDESVCKLKMNTPMFASFEEFLRSVK